MKKLSSAVFIFLALAISIVAIEKPFLSKEAKGWKEVEALERGGKKPMFPTIKYVPVDGRNAALLITVIGKGNGSISDIAALNAVHKMACQPFLAGPNQKFETRDLALPHARGVYSTFEDPDLVGKPPVREDYKFTTPIEILFETGAVAHATIFADERSGRTFDEAMELLKSCELKSDTAANSGALRPPPTGDLIIFSRPGLDATLSLPRAGLSAMPSLRPQDDSYFCFVRNDGLEITGWLEPGSEYHGFKSMWDTDKKKMEEGMGIKLQNEKFEVINGWQVVIYAIQLSPDFAQWNLRASRTWGHTWADVHLSSNSQSPNADTLKEFLKKITLSPAAVGKPRESNRL